MLGDILRKNFIEDCELSLVRGESDIEETRRRLKTAYGDPKIMLIKEMEILENSAQLWKISNPEKLSDVLSKVITLFKDIIN